MEGAQLHLRAVEAANGGRYARAEALLARAEAQTESPDLRARIDGTRAYIMARTGALPEAEELCRAAVARSGLSAAARAVLLGQLGALAERAGRLDEAEELLGSAIAASDDAVAAARMRTNRSLINMQRRRLDAAAADAAAAAQTYLDHGMPVDEAQVRHNLGYIDLLRGNLVPALTAMLDAREVLAAESAVSAAVGDVDRAEVLRDAGLTSDAERLLESAAAVFGAHRMPQSRAETEVTLARSLLTHDPARAARTARRAAARLRTLGNETAALRADALAMRARLTEGAPSAQGKGPVRVPGRAPSTSEVAVVAAALVRHGFTGDAAALRATADLHGIRAGAHGGLQRAPRVPVHEPIDVQLLVHEMRAEHAAHRGDAALVRRRAAAGIDALERWQRTFGSLDLRTSIAMNASRLIFAGLSAAVATGRPEVVFDWSERARHLSQQSLPLRPPPDAELAADLAELRALRAGDPDGAWLREPRAAALHERVRARQWAGTGVASVQERIGIGELRAHLDDDTVVLAYVFDGAALSAVRITTTSAEVVPLPGWTEAQRGLAGLRADLDMSASVRTGPLGERVRASLAHRLDEIARAIVAPALVGLPQRRVVLTVPGVLNGVPWSMLPGLRERVVVLASSATRWTHRGAPRPPASALFVVGPRVRRGAEEIDRATRAWTAPERMEGSAATVDAVAARAGRADVLHVAAHGRHAVDQPLFSGLELSDGTLFGYDIDRMPAVPRTVVLSACEVGRSSVRWGEEAVGMTRVWLHAGAHTVIAAPVVVADDVACELLAAMHELLSAGTAPAEALHAASTSTGIAAPFIAHGGGF